MESNELFTKKADDETHGNSFIHHAVAYQLLAFDKNSKTDNEATFVVVGFFFTKFTNVCDVTKCVYTV
jgi:hypothetical protein